MIPGQLPPSLPRAAGGLSSVTMSSPHGIPGLKLRNLESYVERLAAIEADATSDEMPMLAYLINVAKLEAESQVTRAAEEKAALKVRPDDLWRPV